MANIIILIIVFLMISVAAEYLLCKVMQELGIQEAAYINYHRMCSVMRLIWMYLCIWFSIHLLIVIIGLYGLFYLDIVPYRRRRVRLGDLTRTMYLIFISLLMTVVTCAGILGFNMEYVAEHVVSRIVISGIAFAIFDVICILLLWIHPSFLWKKDQDRFPVRVYTSFLVLCIGFHWFDAFLLVIYNTTWLGYHILISGDVLIFVLLYNFLRYNYAFEKSREAQHNYQESEIEFAKQYFEKKALNELSKKDALTHAYNRREISEIMEEHIKMGRKLVCVFIDLDGLKLANDQYGHEFGDDMLKRFAEACVAVINGKGNLSRIGGDEFLIVLTEQEIDKVEKMIIQLQTKLQEPEEEKDRIYFSYGISWDEASVEQYINVADKKMYICKKRKRCGQV